jgi:membrane protease YdiL (CAAX protease family)
MSDRDDMHEEWASRQQDDQPQDDPPEQISAPAAALVYSVLIAIATAIGWYLRLDLLVWRETAWSWWQMAALGVGVGLAVVACSQVLDRTTEWAKRLSREFGKYFGKVNTEETLMLAISSGVAEEVFFRGVVQQGLTTYAFSGPHEVWLGIAVSSLIFGLLHIGPDMKTFLPWTAMALAMGVGFGWMYWATGTLLAPVLAHFTINFLNIRSISKRYGVDSSARR